MCGVKQVFCKTPVVDRDNGGQQPNRDPSDKSPRNQHGHGHRARLRRASKGAYHSADKDGPRPFKPVASQAMDRALRMAPPGRDDAARLRLTGGAEVGVEMEWSYRGGDDVAVVSEQEPCERGLAVHN
jgi:hypothetical protein